MGLAWEFWSLDFPPRLLSSLSTRPSFLLRVLPVSPLVSLLEGGVGHGCVVPADWAPCVLEDPPLPGPALPDPSLAPGQAACPLRLPTLSSTGRQLKMPLDRCSSQKPL